MPTHPDLPNIPHPHSPAATPEATEPAALTASREVSMYVDRRRVQRRAALPPLMETYLGDLSTHGRAHTQEKAPGRLRPFVTWCAGAGVDPVHAVPDELARFRVWLEQDYRLPDGGAPQHHTKRHILGVVRMWYAWMVQAGHRGDDPSVSALAPSPSPGSRERHQPPARFIHTPLHPLMEAHLESHRLRGREPTSRAASLVLRQFAAWCARDGLDPLRLTREQADAYLVWMSTEARTPAGEPLARQTIEMRIAYLKSWYEWLEIRGDIVVNPAEKLRVRVVRSRVVVREHLTLQEAIAVVQTQAQAVLDAPPNTVTWAKRLRLLAAVCLGLATGRRIGGLLAIRVEDLDLERQELRVVREKGRTGRVLPVVGWAVAVVRAYLTQARPLLTMGADRPWLFVGDGGALSGTSLRTALDELITRTVAANPDLEELPGKTISWHSLRVSFATMLFGNGCPIRSVNELMLHRCLSTTAKYTPIPIEDMHQVWRTAHPRP